MYGFKIKRTPESLLSDLEPSKGGCLLWKGKPGNAGYGRTSFCGKKYSIHRLSYTLFNGEIPRGMWVLHKCDVKLCANPEHLFLGTCKDNVLDAVKKGLHTRMRNKFCPSGHEFTPENTRYKIQPNGSTHRSCKTCTRARVKKYDSEHRGRKRDRRLERILVGPAGTRRTLA